MPKNEECLSYSKVNLHWFTTCAYLAIVIIKWQKSLWRGPKKNKLPMEPSACESPFRNKKRPIKNQDRSKNSTVRYHLIDRITAYLLFTKASQHGFVSGFFPLISLFLPVPKWSILWSDPSVSTRGRNPAARGTPAFDSCCSMEHIRSTLVGVFPM